jgi:hypothetical protein
MDPDQNTRGTFWEQAQSDPDLVHQLMIRLWPFADRIKENQERVSRLLEFYDEVLNKREGGKDVLRAAVVFIHAYLEDFLRTLASELLPGGDESCLKDIPLAGSGTGSFGRSEKFVLGQLAQHRGKTVDEILRQSVSDYFSRSTFNNTKDITALLTRLGLKPEDHNRDFAAIDQMIQRRHQIVHRADRVNEDGTLVLQPIKRSQVTEWLEATHNFTATLMGPLLRRLPKLLKPKSQPGT